jgi:zinc protease
MKTLTILLAGLLLLTAIPASAQLKLPPIEEKTLPNGLDVVVIENHELPVVSMRMVIRSGSTYDPADKAGLADMTAGLLRKGTKTRTATEVADAIDFVGGNIGGNANRDATVVTCSVLHKHFDVGLDVLSDIVLHPVFADEEIERIRRQTLAGIQQSKDDPATICTRGFNQMLFGDNPYARPSGGTEASVTAITADDIKNFYKTYYKPNNAFMLVAGDVKPDEVFQKVEKAFGSWKRGDIPPLEYTSPQPPKGYSILLIDKPDATQSNIRFGHLGITRSNEDYFPMLLMNYVLGSSFTSRLTQAVRVEKGLTYDIRTVNEYNIMPAAYYCNTFTQNDSTVQAITTAIAEIRKMMTEPISDEEYDEAVNFYSGYYPMSLETPNDVAGEIMKVKLYGLPVSYIEDFTKNVRKVTKDDIMRAAQRHLDPDNMVFCVVSNADDVAKSLETLGPVKIESIDEF